MEFRSMAWRDCEAARSILETGENEKLEFAALKLRKALEALTYDRALMYEQDLGPDNMRRWQPDKLLECMLEIDPDADHSSKLYVRRMTTPNVEPKEFDLLLEDNKIKWKDLRKHYHRLGSYLHCPTIDRLRSGKPVDLAQMRTKCELILQDVTRVLESGGWNVDFNIAASIKCMRCGEPIRRRIFQTPGTRTVECWSCNATYDFTVDEPNDTRFAPRRHRVPCSTKDCEAEFLIWERDHRPGHSWSCDRCGQFYRVVVGVAQTNSDTKLGSQNK